MWDQLDRKSLVATLSPWLRDLFFMFAVTNSCVNPFVHSTQMFVDLFKACRVRTPAVNLMTNRVVLVNNGLESSVNGSNSQSVNETHV